MRYQYNLTEPYFIAENIDILNVSRPKNYTYSFHNGRAKHGFIYTVKGEIRITFPNDKNSKIYIGEGELIFIPKESVYISRYSGEDTHIKIIQFDLASGALPKYMSKPIKMELPDVKNLIEAFFIPVENHMINNTFYYFSQLYNLLWKINENYSKVPTRFKKLQPALSEINEHCDENKKVSYYSDLCDMSEVNFRRVFKEYTGMSPVEYRNDIRLNTARAKLRSGEYNVSEAAETSGFTNLSFFIRIYKKKFGYTPKKE